MRRGSARPLLLTGVCAAALAACGSASTPTNGPSATTSSPAAPTTATSSGTSTATTSAAPSTPAVAGCVASNLRLTLGTSQGAAGTFYQPVDFQNVGSEPCTLTGYPGVSFTDSAGRQIGEPAARAGLGVPVRTVVLQPGAFANAAVALPNTDNFPPGDCQAAPFSDLRVFPPNETVAVLLPLAGNVCTTDKGRTQVSPVQAGRG